MFIRGVFFMIACATTCMVVANPRNALVNQVHEKLPAIHGWCSEEKSAAIIDLLLKEKPSVCVEIGVFGGSSVLPIASALKMNGKGQIWAIDPWDTQECLKGITKPSHKEWWNAVNLEKIYLGFIEMLQREKLCAQCQVLRMTSAKALSFVPSEIDVLHIDGNHSEESALFDATHYVPRVKPGGYIWFDDITWDGTEVKNTPTKAAYDYMLQFCEPVFFIDKGNCVLLRKR